ncbi:MAG: CPBP family intramembrane glutamic endopeptidase [Elusimicrobiota bacterium]
MRDLSSPALYVGFELGVGLLALGLGRWLFGSFLFFESDAGPRALARAAVFWLPLGVFAVLVTSARVIRRLAFARRIYEDLRDCPVGDFIRFSGWPAFAALSIMAGASEELLFRGVLQAKAGLWISALLFGAMHALSWAYFWMAAALGLYLGWVYELTGRNLLVPAFLHAGYDFAVLLLFRRRMREDPEGHVGMLSRDPGV